jgi:hypothetical protein
MGGEAEGESRAEDLAEARRQREQQLGRVDEAQDGGGHQRIEADAEAAGVEIGMPEGGLMGGIGEGEELAQGPAIPSGKRHELAREAHGALGFAFKEGATLGALLGVGDLDGVDVAGRDLVAFVGEAACGVAGGGDGEDARFAGEGGALDLGILVHLAEEETLRAGAGAEGARGPGGLPSCGQGHRCSRGRGRGTDHG